ncbi:hypothetical protein CIB95_07680 [Lottiidibacillus patelloidae]|uniref:Uncharacterized protein n=2 Tax=Lottiidibacillus patelloidae TaxID=2670334 RepID=A0A263BUW0_9BACI|nr:hypothetical protein CIB95_07680 [Lottiidibacillus patelloidae]
MAVVKMKPKFKVGDKVVITSYGTIGTITHVEHYNGIYFYKVNSSEVLFTSSELKLADESDTSIYKEDDVINIEYKFNFGDIVLVDGYEDDLFKVVGYRTEMWRYPNDSWEVVIYELSRITDGEWLEAEEEEMTFISSQKNIGDLQLLKNYSNLTNVKKNQTKKRTDQKELPHGVMKTTKEEKINEIDELLDMYNDYKWLFEHFGDTDYKKKLKRILTQLRDKLGK